MTGMMDEVSLWTSTLTDSEIACIYHGGINPSSGGLQLYYTFNQGTSGGMNTSITALQDMSAHIDGTLSGLAMNGNTSNFVGGTSTYTVSAATICPGGTYQFGSQTITAAGSYMHGFGTSGCDSVVQLNLKAGPLVTTVSISNETLSADQSGAMYQWLDCNNGFSSIFNETNQSYQPIANGSYAVLVTAGSCSDTSSCYAMTSVGIAEPGLISGVRIFPNPFSDRLELDLKNVSQDAVIIIFNNLGEKIYTLDPLGKKQILIHTQTWNAGVYIVKIESKAGYWVGYIVKE